MYIYIAPGYSPSTKLFISNFSGDTYHTMSFHSCVELHTSVQSSPFPESFGSRYCKWYKYGKCS